MCAWTDEEDETNEKVKIKKLPKASWKKKPTMRSAHEEELANQLESYGFPPPNFQTKLNPERDWTSDFAWIEQHGNGDIYDAVIVEVHGGYGGSIKKESQRNYEKSNWYVMQGFKVLHVTPEMIRDGSAAIAIYKMLESQTLILEKSVFNKKSEKYVWKPVNKKLRKFYEQWIDIKV